MPRISKKKRLEKAEAVSILQSELTMFRSLCRFFDLNLEELHHNLNKRFKIKEYYPDFNSFKSMLINRPMSVMRKDEIREAVLHVSMQMKEDVFKAMANIHKYDEIRAKWTI